MSALDPSGPSQPTTEQAFETSGNPASKNPSEKAHANAQAHDNSEPVDQRIPREQSSQNDTRKGEWGLGRGVHGAGTGEEGKGLTQEDVGRHNELDGEQMAMPGEGRVADAVAGRGSKGVGGEQEDLASDLDR